jgi:hypothetical protein
VARRPLEIVSVVSAAATLSRLCGPRSCAGLACTRGSPTPYPNQPTAMSGTRHESGILAGQIGTGQASHDCIRNGARIDTVIPVFESFA